MKRKRNIKIQIFGKRTMNAEKLSHVLYMNMQTQIEKQMKCSKSKA
jgi:hypothetical protein